MARTPRAGSLKACGAMTKDRSHTRSRSMDRRQHIRYWHGESRPPAFFSRAIFTQPTSVQAGSRSRRATSRQMTTENGLIHIDRYGEETVINPLREPLTCRFPFGSGTTGARLGPDG